MAKAVKVGSDGFEDNVPLRLRQPKAKSNGSPTRTITLLSVVGVRKDGTRETFEEQTSPYIATRIHEILEGWIKSATASGGKLPRGYVRVELEEHQRVVCNKGWEEDGQGGYRRRY